MWVCVLQLRFRLCPASCGWVAGVCVFVCSLRLCPATPGWGVRRGCVCLGSGFGCTLPLPAGLLGCVCVRVRASLVPRHSWLGCAVWVGVLGLRLRLRPATPGCRVGVCMCALRFSPATPGLGVRCGWACLGLGFSCPPPLLAGVLGCVCARVRALLVPRHSWQGCTVPVCVRGLRFRLCPATPGWAAGICLRLRARSSCTLPLLAGVCGAGVCAWARVLAAPHHSWLGSRGVCVLVCALRLYPATPGWSVLCGCVCLGSGFGCAPPLRASVLGCVCVCVRAPLVPRHSWLGCVVWVCVLGVGFRLRPATSGWSVGGCVCPSTLRLYPAKPLLGFVVCGFGVAWHLFLCRGSVRVVRAARVCGTWWPLLLGTCPCALIVAGGVPLWRARWPHWVRRASSGPVALRAPVGFPDAMVPFPVPGACAPGFTGWLRGARGGRPRTGLIVPAAGPRQGRGAGLAPRRTCSGLRDGVVPGGSLRRRSWAVCAAVVSCGDPVTDASGFPYGLSFDRGTR